MSKRFTLSLGLLFSVFIHAQSVTIPDTLSDFFKPRFAVFVAPLAMADYIGGYNFRCGAEYTLGEKVNGLTEVSVYMPWHQQYCHVSGFRIRQDFRKYNMKEYLFMGASFMIKQQNIDYLAVVPITDSTRYVKPYTLRKTVLSPSFTLGGNVRIDEHWYMEVTGYAGFRVKFAQAEGLTPTERATKWLYDDDYTRWDMHWMLREGQNLAIELQASIRIGYVFG